MTVEHQFSTWILNLVCAIVIGLVCSPAAAQPFQAEVGQSAAEIEGIDLDGVSFKLSDYRGKVVFLDFWGDW